MIKDDSNPKLSQDQIREVSCIICDAKPGEFCNDQNGVVLLNSHQKRVELRSKFPAVPFKADLNPDDKALITYYAYVMLCDSVSAKSLEMLGKQLSSREIQVSFAKRAIIELKKDGLLK